MNLNELDAKKTNRPFGLEFIFMLCILFAFRGAAFLFKNLTGIGIPNGTPQQELAQQILASRHILFGGLSALCILGIAMKKPSVRLLMVALPIFKYTCTYITFRLIDVQGLGLGLFLAVIVGFYLYGMKSVRDYFFSSSVLDVMSAV